jgi:hypothetical protein
MRSMHRRRGVVALVATAVLLAGANTLPASAASISLSAPAYGVVDFGDGVSFTVSGPSCRSVATHVRLRAAGAEVSGHVVRGCEGAARVPTFEQVRALGWQQGDPISVALVAGDKQVELRYQRVEVDRATPAAGAPKITAGTDPDTGPHDLIMAMATGDAVDLGRVNVEQIDSIALRMCFVRTPGLPLPVTNEMDVPARISLHQDAPDGPALVHEIDASFNPTTLNRLQTWGFGGSCWRLGTFPITGRAIESAPRLFLKVDLAAPDTFWVNSIDFNGTGARSAAAPNWATPDPAGMQTIFDGTSFDGWSQTGCALRDGAVTNATTSDRTAFDGCTLTHAAAGTNRVIRLEVRRENFYDNGGIMVPSEIQLRSAGEFLPGGYFLEYAARWQKLNTWPAWSQVEIVQLGDRYVVRVNGRTVTDHVAVSGAPRAHQLQIVTQPIFSYRSAAGNGFGNEAQPDLTTPDEWGGFWFRNIRVYDCASTVDPVCTAIAAVNDGQAPKA